MQSIGRLSQRAKTIHSVHDADGNRLAEYEIDIATSTATLLWEYIWHDGVPVAVVDGQTEAVFFVRTDHIGRPVFATDDTGAKVWEASYLPFGGVHVSTGAAIDLRFPGQWFHAENGLHQNWMRDYDPTTGRYIQADPLGLVDGASVYGYALQNPGRYTDPTGELVPHVLAGMTVGIVAGYLQTGCVEGAIAGGIIGAGFGFAGGLLQANVIGSLYLGMGNAAASQLFAFELSPCSCGAREFDQQKFLLVVLGAGLGSAAGSFAGSFASVPAVNGGSFINPYLQTAVGGTGGELFGSGLSESFNNVNSWQ